MTERLSTDEYRQRRLAMMTETDFLRAVVTEAHRNGWRLHHQRPCRTKDGWASAIIGDKGFPDMCLVRGGKVMFWELKSEKGRVSEDQQRWIDQLGSVAMVLRPSDWPYIEKALR
ncbi:MAG: hypothetical protein GEU73_07775 [Chloroflexi bacterium]|nr:hypothetical protein [Chloroflexota bacterium]